ncbi:MAG: hypothetical protein Ct9H300mP8_06050 [Gammaproteobacteria bacterium]|nr:MAG: hypothetical protein Ct9H300mP8_06050 [Gammaproteobacteria bacterium]
MTPQPPGVARETTRVLMSSGMLWGVGPEIGHLAAIIGFVAAVVLGLLGHLGAATRRKTWIENAGSVAVLQLVGLVFAFALLVHAFLGTTIRSPTSPLIQTRYFPGITRLVRFGVHTKVRFFCGL